MIITNAHALLSDFSFHDAAVAVENDTIREIGTAFRPDPCEPVLDASGLYLIPGLIDVHMHGYYGCCCEGSDPQKMHTIGRHLAEEGVTGYAATIASSRNDQAFAAIEANVRAHNEHQPKRDGAKILAIHMEGPFLNPVRKGGMDESCLQAPSVELLEQYVSRGNGLVRIMTIAPELPGADKVIYHGTALGLHMSMGHTNAVRREVMSAIEWGICRSTHTFNAMRPLHHRESGVLGAALTDDRIECELIGDFVHVAAEVCQMVYHLKGKDRVTLISDSCEMAGLRPDQVPADCDLILKEAAYLPNGTLCGSLCTVMKCVRNMVSIGVPLGEAVKMASYNAARDIGAEHETGSIKPGKKADLVLADRELNVKAVLIDGQMVVDHMR